jgi:hypothetical protein
VEGYLLPNKPFRSLILLKISSFRVIFAPKRPAIMQTFWTAAVWLYDYQSGKYM